MHTDDPILISEYSKNEIQLRKILLVCHSAYSKKTQHVSRNAQTKQKHTLTH